MHLTCRKLDRVKAWEVLRTDSQAAVSQGEIMTQADTSQGEIMLYARVNDERARTEIERRRATQLETENAQLRLKCARLQRQLNTWSHGNE